MMNEKKAKCLEAGLTCFDFIPKCIRPDSLMHWPEFESFSKLVEPANAFLRSSPSLSLVSCETIHLLVSKDHIEKPDQSDFIQHGESIRPFVKALRLWVTPRQDGTDQIQQIGYVSFLPKTDQGPTQTLELLTRQANDWLMQNPIPGRILTVEPLLMRGVDGEVNPDASTWKAGVSVATLGHAFLQFFRIFYVVGEPAYETIGFADFFTQVTQQGGLASWPKVGQYPEALLALNRWAAAMPSSVRLLNVNTVICRAHNRNGEPSNLYTAFYNDGRFHKYHRRFLRVAFATPTREWSAPPSYITRQVSAKLFAPGLVEDPKWYRFAKFERHSTVQARVDDWVRQTNAKVLGVETVVYKTASGAERFEGPLAMHTWNEAHYNPQTKSEEAENEQYYKCLRVYTDGEVADPADFVFPRSMEDYRREHPGKCAIS